MQKTTDEWVEVFAGEVPAGPVYDLAQALDNPYFRERGGVAALDHPDRPGLKTVASPIRMAAKPPTRPGPKLGQHTDDLLSGLGYSAAEIDAMHRDDVI
jgi:crotonobetainyl-CoA:carnitine CoA-transferase CaiB-like acyl-CoA transferase